MHVALIKEHNRTYIKEDGERAVMVCKLQAAQYHFYFTLG